VRALAQGGIYAGVVTAVGRAEARVSLAPGVEGSVPFSTMAWARPFKPEQRTASPTGASDVVAVGDVVSVRVAELRLGKTQMGSTVQHIDFALEQDPLVQGAFAAIDLKTRGVLALVGGSDIAKSQFNRATQAKRQPGSSFKPFLYAAAIESGKYTPLTKVDDAPEVITDPWSGKTWKPQNFEKDEFDGPITLRKALAESKNTVAVKLLLELGLDKVSAEAHEAGISSSIPQSYTAALGTGELGLLEEVNGYATLGSLGRYADPIFIRKVTARDGAVVMRSEASFEQKMRPDVAYVTADMMRSVIDDPDGTAHSLSSLGRPAAGKTGTASEHRDGWFIGFTPSIVAGAWVGFDDHQMMGSIETGGHCAGPIWLNFMRVAVAATPYEDWPAVPPGVTEAKVNPSTGALAAADDPYGVREVFLSGTEPAPAQNEDEKLEPPSQEQFYQQGQ
jgi:penicillin-binding protein 1A